jgi:hypothetical protein
VGSNSAILILLKAGDFNQKLHERGCPTKLSAQEICKTAKDENQTKEIFEKVWTKPRTSIETIASLRQANMERYQFERAIEAPIDA